MKGTFESLQAEIATQLAERDKECTEAAIKLRRLRFECRKLRAASKALGEDMGDESEASDQKKAPKQSDVTAALNELLSENPTGIDRVDLEPLLAERLATKHHRSAVGLALRIKEVLASGQFVEQGGVVQTALRAPVAT
jgi:hypothetical protein